MGKLPAPKHNHSILKFPEHFLWGAATSAYQVEGGNIYSDWWDWEQKNQPPSHQSGQACDQYHLYEQDFELARSLGQNAHRLSIEWSRIEPKNGEFDHHEIEHYQKVLKSLKDKNFKVMLTLWHLTLPKWIADLGGWRNPQTVRYFERFVQRIVPELKSHVDFWITLNEPTVYAWGAYSAGIWPPNKKSRWDAFWVFWNLCKAHKKAYKAIHLLDQDAKVGAAHQVSSFSAAQEHSILQHILVWIYDLTTNHIFYKFTGLKTHDFLGFNYYFHQTIGSNKNNMAPKTLQAALTNMDVSDMGWEVFPEGMFDILRDMAGYKKPIYITENGLASTNDDRRCRFLISYLKEIYHAGALGADIRGYFHWSLIDNFEWADGFRPRFGLVEVDYSTQKRTPRPSAFVYQDIIRHNGIAHHLMRFIGHTVSAQDVLERAKNIDQPKK